MHARLRQPGSLPGVQCVVEKRIQSLHCRLTGVSNMSVLRLLLVVFGILYPIAAEAGLLVTVGDLLVAAGGDGHVDVMISSDSGDSLAGFVDMFEISGSGLAFATG